MDKAYWEDLANNFKQDVFEVYKNDANGLIARAIQAHSHNAKTASDVGCGVGSLLPKLADSFSEVNAIDISPKCLKRAKKYCSQYSNIRYLDVDLSAAKAKLPSSDFSLCVNALIFPSLKGRINFLNTMVDALNNKGILLLVVPSLESALLRNHREIQWNLKSGMNTNQAQQSDFVGIDGVNAKNLSLGLISLDGVKTKHFLREELFIMLEQRGLAVLDINKIEYSWDTEFFKPPQWMQAPFPWDWFCLARKM